MLNTFIKNRGTTKTIIHNNNKNNVSEIKWDADYDGKEANISVNMDNNGDREKYHFLLDNNDLANILNLNSVNLPIEKRLKRDFKKISEPKIIQIELEDSENPILSSHFHNSLEPQDLQNIMRKPILMDEPILMDKPLSIEEIITPQKAHISSPLLNEEFIIPVTIDGKTSDKFTFAPNKRNHNLKTHKKYKVYKHKKPSTRSKSSRSKKTSRKSKVLSSKLFSLL